MHKVREKIAYLQGIAENLEGDMSPRRQARLMSGILDVLEDMAVSLSDLEEAHQQLEDYVDSLDEDFAELEKEVYDEEDEWLHVECPTCHEDVYFEASLLEDDDVVEIVCPSCEEVVFISEGEMESEEKRAEGKDDAI